MKGDAKLRRVVELRDATIRRQRGEIALLGQQLAELSVAPKLCSRCVHRMCAECGTSLLDKYSSAVTCSDACRRARQRRLVRVKADITGAFGMTLGLSSADAV